MAVVQSAGIHGVKLFSGTLTDKYDESPAPRLYDNYRGTSLAARWRHKADAISTSKNMRRSMRVALFQWVCLTATADDCVWWLFLWRLRTLL